MSKPKSRKDREQTCFNYLRISRDDKGLDESYSITNQRKLLMGVAKEKGFTNIVEYVDDGINVAGKIDDVRFMKMSAQYTKEQAALAEQIKTLSRELEELESKDTDITAFVQSLQKYTHAKKLMLNELVEHIEVFHATKETGVHHQKIRIFYTCLGSIDIPDVPNVSECMIRIQTRKGVMVEYGQLEEAI